MTSILKVDTIQTTAGAAPTAKDLGFAAGSVIQVAHGSTSTYTSTNSTSFVATNLSCSITPKFSNSEIHLSVSGSVWFGTSNANSTYCIPTIYRDSTNLGVGGYSACAFWGAHGTGYETWDRMIHFGKVDTPSTTSAITYKVYVRAYNTNHDVRLFEGITSNVITAYEIAV